MLTAVQCPGCGKKMLAGPELAGKKVKCPACGTILSIPASGPSESPSSANPVHKQPAKPPTASKSSTDACSAPVKGRPATGLTKATPAKPTPPRREPKNRTEEIDWNISAEELEAGEALSPPADEPAAPAPRFWKSTKSASQKSSGSDNGDSEGAWRDYLPWLLLVTLIPLAISIAIPEEPVAQRLEKTLEEHPELRQHFEKLSESSRVDPITLLPDQRIKGAFLPRTTWMHWWYAALSTVGFLALLAGMFPGSPKRLKRLMRTGLFTGTIGIILLFAVQFLGAISQGIELRGRSVLVLFFYIFKFIGFSYRAALDAGSGFWLSFLGFTCGVGFCEELCKAFPIAMYLNQNVKANWRGACAVGLASGIGFGISEGISYSSDFYNGVTTGFIYLVRFVSCVGLHAMWAGAVAILLHRNREYVSEFHWGNIFAFVFFCLGIAMVLHGLYDTLLKQNQELWALAISGLSFLWLVWLLRDSRANY